MDRRWLLLLGVLLVAAGTVLFVGLQEGVVFPLTEVDGTLPVAYYGFVPLWEVNEFFSAGHYGVYAADGQAYYVDVNADGVFLVRTDDFPSDVVNAFEYGWGPAYGYVQFGVLPDGNVAIAVMGSTDYEYPVVFTKDKVIAYFTDAEYAGGALTFVDGNAGDVWFTKVKGRNDGPDHFAKIYIGHYVYTGTGYDLVSGADVYDESRGDSGITNLYRVSYGVHGIYVVVDPATGKRYLLVDTGGSDSYSTITRVLVLVNPETFGVVDHWESSGPRGAVLGGARLLPAEDNTYYIVGKGAVLDVNVFDGRIASVNVLSRYWPWNAPAGDSHLLPLYSYGDTSLWVYPFQQSSEIVRFEEFEYNSVSGRWRYVGSYAWRSTRNSTSASSLYVRTPDRLYVLVFAQSGGYSYYAYTDANYSVSFSGPLFEPVGPSLQGGDTGGEEQTGIGTVVASGGSVARGVQQEAQVSESPAAVQQASPVSTGVPSWVFVGLVVAMVAIYFVFVARR